MIVSRFAAAAAVIVLAAGITAGAAQPGRADVPCVKTGSHQGNCGPYLDPAIPMSNGYNTRVGNDCWADPSCAQTLTAYSPEDWSVTADEPAGNTSVRTGPEVQQLLNDWCPAQGTWAPLVRNGCPGTARDAPLAALSSLGSSYAETMPRDAATSAEAAWDLWLPGDTAEGYAQEVMVWVDQVNRGFGGATFLAGPVVIGGQSWDLWQYQKTKGTMGEIVWSLLDGTGAPAQQASGSVDLLAMLGWLQAGGYLPADAALNSVDFTFEICSTGGVPETFAVTDYTLTGG